VPYPGKGEVQVPSDPSWQPTSPTAKGALNPSLAEDSVAALVAKNLVKPQNNLSR
jgi:hypothetical protein